MARVTLLGYNCANVKRAPVYKVTAGKNLGKNAAAQNEMIASMIGW